MTELLRQGSTFPIRMARLTASAAARASLVARASETLTFRLEKLQVKAEIRPGSFQPGDWSIKISIDGQPLTLRTSQTTLVALLAAFEPTLVLEPPPAPSIVALLADTLLDSIIAKHGPALGGVSALVGTVPSQAGPIGGVSVQFTVNGSLHRAELLGEETVDRILRDWPTRQHRLSQLRLACWISLGWTELPLPVFERLEPGDAVRIECRPELAVSPMLGRKAEQPSLATLHADGGWSAIVQERQREWVIMEALGPREHRVTERGSAGLESLPIRLDFNVGHRELSLAEIRALQPGVVVGVGAGVSTSELVEITVNGRRIGTGELVQVDGGIAVRITRLFGLD